MKEGRNERKEGKEGRKTRKEGREGGKRKKDGKEGRKEVWKEGSQWIKPRKEWMKPRFEKGTKERKEGRKEGVKRERKRSEERRSKGRKEGTKPREQGSKDWMKKGRKEAKERKEGRKARKEERNKLRNEYSLFAPWRNERRFRIWNDLRCKSLKGLSAHARKSDSQFLIKKIEYQEIKKFRNWKVKTSPVIKITNRDNSF